MVGFGYLSTRDSQSVYDESGSASHPHQTEHLSLGLYRATRKNGQGNPAYPSGNSGYVPEYSKSSNRLLELCGLQGLREKVTLHLIAQEDVYDERGATLLVREGTLIPIEWLPKLIAHGAQPHQFVLERIIEPVLDRPIPESLAHRHMNGLMEEENVAFCPLEPGFSPMTQPELPTAGPKQAVSHEPPEPVIEPILSRTKEPVESFEVLGWEVERLERGDVIPPKLHCGHIVIYDPEQKGIRRLMGCLKRVGVPMLNIHTAVTLEQFHRAVDQYQPRTVFVDLAVGNTETTCGFGVLEGVFDTPGSETIEKRVLTVSVPPEKEHLKGQLVDKATDSGIDVCFKPLNRRHVEAILTETVHY